MEEKEKFIYLTVLSIEQYYDVNIINIGI